MNKEPAISLISFSILLKSFKDIYNNFILHLSNMLQKSITHILQNMKKQKTSVLSKANAQIIETILKDQKRPKYPHEILALYRYTTFTEDKNFFVSFDNLILSSRSAIQKTVLQSPPLQLAFFRLYCLIKYELPYQKWISTVRQAMHESAPLSSTDLRAFISLSFFYSIRLNEKLLQLYCECLSYFSEVLDELDITSLTTLRKSLSISKIQTQLSKQITNRIDEIIEKRVINFSKSHLLLVLNCQSLHNNWIFKYIMNQNIQFSQVAFAIDILNRPSLWRIWALHKYGTLGLISRIPKKSEGDPHSLMKNLISKIRMPQPYSDCIFDLELFEDKHSQTKRWKLKNVEQDISLFIQNAFRVYSGVFNFSVKELQRTQQVLQDVLDGQYADALQAFIYLSLSSSITFYLYKEDRNKKLAIQDKIINNAYRLYKELKQKIPQGMHERYRHSKIIQTKILGMLAILELQSLRKQQFQQMLDAWKKKTIQKQFSQTPNLNAKERINQEIITVIDNLIKGEKSEQPMILCGEFKKLTLSSSPELQKFQFLYADNIQFDHALTANYMIRIKNKSTGEEKKIIADLAFKLQQEENLDEIYKILNIKRVQQQRVNNSQWIIRHWKKRYFEEWHNQIYEVIPEKSLREYFQSLNFLKYFSKNDK